MKLKEGMMGIIEDNDNGFLSKKRLLCEKSLARMFNDLLKLEYFSNCCS